MKIAVYTIALNEEKFVARWFESAKDADYLLIADTGSTDTTVKAAQALGIHVQTISVSPWRFDVARNASLALLPDDIDICIQLDMDETLQAGWREIVEKAFAEGIDWPIYKHVNGRYPDGSIRSYQDYFKIHPRKGFIWKYPIHEIVTPETGVQYRRAEIDLEVDHNQDHSKDRKSYFDLLQMAVAESPQDWRMAHYLVRELWYRKEWSEIIKMAYKALEISGGWDIERASTCMWASEAALAMGFPEWALEWARKGTNEAQKFYEAWHWRANVASQINKWDESLESAKKIDVLFRQSHHLVKPEIWEWWGFDLVALASHKLGDHETAIRYGMAAINGAPSDERLKANLGFYRAAHEAERANTLGLDDSEDESLIYLSETPLVLWAILVKNGGAYLPLYLECLLKQDYPKESISLYIRTNDNTDNTVAILEKFIEDFGSLFHSIEFNSQDIDSRVNEIGAHEWNPTRTNLLGRIRQDSLLKTLEVGCEFYFVADIDNFIKPNTLSTLVRLQLEIVAPLVRYAGIEESNGQPSWYYGNYANYHDEIYEDAAYKHSENYHRILNQEYRGITKVQLVHCTYLVRADVIPHLNYLYEEDKLEYRNFALSAVHSDIPQYIDNREIYGYLTFDKDVEFCAEQFKKLA
ncbi:MAG: hypothetical protein WCO08_07685 [Actinomycetes bacterium]